MVASAASLAAGGRATLVRRVKLVSWLSLAWMTTEGVVGVAAGIAANSIALIGYGIDAAIQGLASLVIVWRFTGARVDSERAEARARKIVAVTFFLLAPYIAIEAIRRLASGEQAEGSWIGVALAVVSTLLMPVFGHAKKTLGRRLCSAATTGEGTQNLLCAYLSCAILVGLGLNAVWGLAWADPAAALVVAVAAVHAGARTWRGDGCAAGAL